MTHYLAARTHCVNGHDITDPTNLAPALPTRRPGRRCVSCVADDNETRRLARIASGLTQRAFYRRFGSSRTAALKVLEMYR